MSGPRAGTLWTKLRRDLWILKGQSLAIALVLGAGIALLVASMGNYAGLRHARDRFYARTRFADVFTSLKRAPREVVSRAGHLPGVEAAEGRLVFDVRLAVEGLSEPATGRLISLPEGQPPRLNAVEIAVGRIPTAVDEVAVGSGFAEAHRLAPGDTVRAVLNGRLRTLRLTGVVLSPEYIFGLPPGEILPDDKRFTVLFAPVRAVEAAFDMKEAVNDLSLTVSEGVETRRVVRDLDNLLERYGGLGAIERAEQVSHRLLSDEISQLKNTATIVPTIFLLIAAFLLHVVLTRTVGVHREQIAILKAFGVSDARIALHYAAIAGVIVVLGLVLGTGGGVVLGRAMTELYTRFYKLPGLSYRLEVSFLLPAAAACAAAAAIGAIGAARAAASLPPAEAMRPPAPPRFRPLLPGPLRVLLALLSPGVRIATRNIGRRPGKSALTAIGLSFAAAVLVLGGTLQDAFLRLMELQFEVLQREDLTLSFREPVTRDALFELLTYPGVSYVEGIRAVPVTLEHGHRTERTAIQGLERSTRLRAPRGPDLEPIPLPEDGLLLSRKLGDLLHVAPGDEVWVHVLEGRRERYRARVAALADDWVGVAAYMEQDALFRLLREGPSITQALILADPVEQPRLYEEIEGAPRVAAVTRRTASLRVFEDEILEQIQIQAGFQLAFAVLIAVGIVYNTARVALSERSLELATLRVLGLTRIEVTLVLLSELLLLALIAIPPGLVLGHGLAELVVRAFSTELFRIPFAPAPRSFGVAALAVLGSTLACAVTIYRSRAVSGDVASSLQVFE